jgi:transcriptional regulator with XRE-family HTH domain
MKKQVIPRRVVHLRRLLCFSQAELARRSGLNVSTINSIESGFHDPRCSTIELVAKALLVLPGYLLGSDPELDSPVSAGTIAADQLYAYYAGVLQAIMSPRRCRICSQQLPSGEPHGAGNCMVHLYESGKPKEFLAITFGFCPAAVDAMLDAEYERGSGSYGYTARIANAP